MKAWLIQHRSALLRALRRLSQAPGSTLLGALVIGIAAALPASGQWFLRNFDMLGARVSGTPQISVFLADDASREQASAVEARLKDMDGIERIEFVPREQTLSRLKQNEGLSEVIESLPRNPFPDAFIVEPAASGPDALEQLRAELATWPKVDHVQLDSEWVRRLHALLSLGRTIVAVLAALLGVALVVVTFNTIRLQILTQRDEIEVSRLLGATAGFIRRPFFYFGALQGLLGGCVAWLIVLGVSQMLKQPISHIAGLYGLSFSPDWLPTTDSLVLLGLAALLGWIGALLSVSRHLREPASAA